MPRGISSFLVPPITALAFLIAALDDANASQVVYQFTGVLTEVNDGTAAPQFGSSGGLEGDFGIEVGTPFFGTGWFSMEGTDTRSDPNWAFYSVPGSLTLSLGSASLTSGPNDRTGISVYNDYSDDPEFYPYQDHYQGVSALRPDPGLEQFSTTWVAAWNLYDTTLTALISDALDIPPPFDRWETSWFHVSQGTLETCHPIPWENCTQSRPEYRNAHVNFGGVFTSVTFVPEPSTGLLVFAGLLGFAARRRARP